MLMHLRRERRLKLCCLCFSVKVRILNVSLTLRSTDAWSQVSTAGLAGWSAAWAQPGHVRRALLSIAAISSSSVSLVSVLP